MFSFFWLAIPAGVTVGLIVYKFLLRSPHDVTVNAQLPAASLGFDSLFSTTFAYNFMLDLFGFVTGGLGSLYINFRTWLFLTLTLLILPPPIIYTQVTGLASVILELLGSSCFAGIWLRDVREKRKLREEAAKSDSTQEQ